MDGGALAEGGGPASAEHGRTEGRGAGTDHRGTYRGNHRGNNHSLDRGGVEGSGEGHSSGRGRGRGRERGRGRGRGGSSEDLRAEETSAPSGGTVSKSPERKVPRIHASEPVTDPLTSLPHPTHTSAKAESDTEASARGDAKAEGLARVQVMRSEDESPWGLEEVSAKSSDVNSPSFQLPPLRASMASGPALTLVQTRNNESFVGVVKSYDQHGNLVVDHASRRFIQQDVFWPEAGATYALCYADLYQGTLLLRGDAITCFGEFTSSIISSNAGGTSNVGGIAGESPLMSYLKDVRAASEDPEGFERELLARALSVEAPTVRSRQPGSVEWRMYQIPLSLALQAARLEKEQVTESAQLWADFRARAPKRASDLSIKASFRRQLLRRSPALSETMVDQAFELYLRAAGDACAFLRRHADSGAEDLDI